MSTLLADTIRKTGGTAGVDIRVKNTSVYETDNSTSNTQNLVQSLVKTWFTATNDSGDAIFNDSFNCSSTTDVAGGNYTIAYTNNFGGNKIYTVSGCMGHASDITDHVYNVQPKQDDDVTSSSIELITVYASNNTSGIADYSYFNAIMCGDLA